MITKAIALQTARGGSVGVKNKNIMNLNGIPLFLHNIIHLSNSKYVESTYLSTDISIAGNYAERYNFSIIDRPPSLATSSCSHYDVMVHGVEEILKDVDFEYIVIVLGNSIGALPSDVDAAIEFLDSDSSYDSCQSVSEHNWHTPMRACTIEDDLLKPHISRENMESVSGNLNDRAILGNTYFFNGSFFVIRKDAFFRNDGFPFSWTGKKVKPIIQDEMYMELDSEWQKCVFKRFEEDDVKLSKFIKGKRAIIIGPSGNSVSDCKDIDVDSYDLIVRINHHYGMATDEEKESIGFKTHMIYHCLGGNLICADDIDKWREENTKIISRYPLHVRNPVRYKHNEFYHIDGKGRFVNEMRAILGCNPNTGMLAIYHLLRMGVQSLTVAGFDFYQTAYMHADYSGRYSLVKDLRAERYRKRMKNNEFGLEKGLRHNPDRQFEFFKELVQEDDRIILTGFLKSVIEQ